MATHGQSRTVEGDDMNTTAAELLPKIDKIAGKLRHHLCLRANGDYRGEAAGTICPKHRRDWYLKSKGMPTGF